MVTRDRYPALNADHGAGCRPYDGIASIVQPSQRALDRSPTDHDYVSVVIQGSFVYRAPHASSHQAGIEIGSCPGLQFGKLLARGVEQELIHARIVLRRPH